MGEAADPRVVFRLPEKYAAHFEFECEVRSSEALLFPLRRMLNEFAGYCGHVIPEFNDSSSSSIIGAATTQISIGSATSDRNAERFFTLVRERMQNLELPEPVLSLSLTANEFATPTALQTDLLNRSVA